MAKAYSKASEEIVSRASHMLKCFHPTLVNAGLKIDIITVANEDPDDDSPALMHGGYPCDGTIRVINAKERAKGNGDCEMCLDEARYLTMTDAERDALVDHEIYHVELKLNKKGRVVLDEHGRPKLKLRKHDHDFGFFTEIARRHGAASGEVKQATAMFLSERQSYFAFIGEERLSLAAGAAAEPSVQAAARNLVSHLRNHGATMTIRTGDKEVTIDKDGVRKPTA